MQYISPARKLDIVDKKRKNFFALLFSTSNRLLGTLDEIDDFERVLTDPDILGYPKDNIYALHNPDEKVFLDVINNLRKRIEAINDNDSYLNKNISLLVYGNTHGQYNKEKREHSLELVKQPDRKTNILKIPERNLVTIMPTKKLAEALAEIRVKFMTIILDCCCSNKSAYEFANAFREKIKEKMESTTDKNKRIFDNAFSENIESYEAKNIITSTSYRFEIRGDAKDIYGRYRSILLSGIMKALETGAIGKKDTLGVSVCDLYGYVWHYAMEQRTGNSWMPLPSWGDLLNINHSFLRSNAILGYNKRLLVSELEKQATETELLRNVLEISPEIIPIILNNKDLQIKKRVNANEVQYDLLFKVKNNNENCILAIDLKKDDKKEDLRLEEIKICIKKGREKKDKVIYLNEEDFIKKMKDIGIDFNLIPEKIENRESLDKIGVKYKREILGLIVLSPYMKGGDTFNIHKRINQISNLLNCFVHEKLKENEYKEIRKFIKLYCKILKEVYNINTKDYFINNFQGMSKLSEDLQFEEELLQAMNPKYLEERTKWREKERQMMEKERQMMEKERQMMEKERQMMEELAKYQNSSLVKLSRFLDKIFGGKK